MRVVCLAMALVLAGPAWAGDGRIEINQDKALAGGVNGSLALDPAGFPVIITDPGSYVLTGDLVVTNPDMFVLDIRANDVTVDLNGFGIYGPQLCISPGSCPQTGVGHGIASFNANPIPEYTTIRNGRVSGFAGCIVLAAAHMHVQGLAVSHCTLAGIQVGDAGLVLENRVSNTRFSGISMGANTAFRDNVVTDADLSRGGTSFAFEGGRAIGGNLCDDTSCNSNPAHKRYYLTKTTFAGNAVLTACAPRFHMASFGEIHETAGLSYDTTLGYTKADSGSGPPLEYGWLRTGRVSNSNTSEPGIGNCDAWTSADPNGGGTAPLTFPISAGGWERPAQATSPWEPTTSSCSFPLRVWCVED